MENGRQNKQISISNNINSISHKGLCPFAFNVCSSLCILTLFPPLFFFAGPGATSSSNSVYNICHNKNSKHGIHMKIWKKKRKGIPRLPSSFVCTTSTNIHITICPLYIYSTTILNHQVPSKQTTAGIYVRGVVQRSSIVCSTTFFLLFSGFYYLFSATTFHSLCVFIQTWTYYYGG